MNDDPTLDRDAYLALLNQRLATIRANIALQKRQVRNYVEAPKTGPDGELVFHGPYTKFAAWMIHGWEAQENAVALKIQALLGTPQARPRYAH